MRNDAAYSVSCSHRITMEQQLFGMWVAIVGIVLLNAVDLGAHSLAQGNESDMEVRVIRLVLVGCHLSRTGV